MQTSRTSPTHHRYCEAHAVGALVPSQLRVVFDGDPLELQKTAHDYDLEDGDLLELFESK